MCLYFVLEKQSRHECGSLLDKETVSRHECVMTLLCPGVQVVTVRLLDLLVMARNTLNSQL